MLVCKFRSVPRNQGTDDQRNNLPRERERRSGRRERQRPREAASLHTSAHFCQGRLPPGRVQADHYLVGNCLVPPSGAALQGSCTFTPALSHHRGPAQAISDQELGPRDQSRSAPWLPPRFAPPLVGTGGPRASHYLHGCSQITGTRPDRSVGLEPLYHSTFKPLLHCLLLGRRAGQPQVGPQALLKDSNPSHVPSSQLAPTGHCDWVALYDLEGPAQGPHVQPAQQGPDTSSRFEDRTQGQWAKDAWSKRATSPDAQPLAQPTGQGSDGEPKADTPLHPGLILTLQGATQPQPRG